MFRITVLCTANQFRSPLAAALLRARTAELPVEVRSAAVSGREGAPALDAALALGPGLGVDLAEHAARRLVLGELGDADLVLGFERTHVAAAVIDGGAARDRSFTMPEFAELAEAVPTPGLDEPVARARAVVRYAADRRALGPAHAGAPELADPAGGPAAAFEDAARRLSDLAERVVRALFDRVRGG
ncbi:MAG TPA: hypothetical protein VM184_10280 [Gaiellaceae bacterium]|nr:hypothetical protein [Gaiellaceae bacterium]